MSGIMQLMFTGIDVFNFNLTTGTDKNLATVATAAGWDGVSPLQANIPSGNVISASSIGTYALTINGTFPKGVTLVNNGIIQGRGGNGGVGGGTDINVANPGTVGTAAGPALFVSSLVSIDNTNGFINGGGGGGGGGGGARSSGGKLVHSYGGGGGGGGIGVGIGASGGSATSGNGSFNFPGGTGATSTTTSNGGGGAGGVDGSGSAGTGGAGGTGGSSGATGGSGAGNAANGAGASGGVAGNCLSGNSNITWIANGTRNGAII